MAINLQLTLSNKNR